MAFSLSIGKINNSPRISILILLGLLFLCLSACQSGPAKKPPEFRNSYKYPGDLGVAVIWRAEITDRSPMFMDQYPQEHGMITRDGDFIYTGGRSKKLFKIRARTGQILSRIKLEEEFFSKPVIQGEEIFLGTSSGQLICYDKNTLAEKWRYEAKSEIIAPPIYKDGVLYFVTQNDTITAINANGGKFIWEYREEFHGTMSIRRHSAPLVLEDKVVVGFTVGTIAAFKLADGEMIWRRDLGESDRFNDVDASPIYLDGNIITASFDGSVYSLNAETGDPVWKTPIKSTSSATIIKGKLYLTSTENGLYCLEPETGKIEWYMEFKEFHNKGLLRDAKEGALSKPEAYRDRYVVFTSSNTGLYFVDIITQRLIEDFTPGVGISVGPTVQGNTVYVLSNGGYLYAVSLTPKGSPWRKDWWIEK